MTMSETDTWGYTTSFLAYLGTLARKGSSNTIHFATHYYVRSSCFWDVPGHGMSLPDS